MNELPDPQDEPLFASVFPAGISYADRRVESDGDYKRCAFLSYRTLKLEIDKNCSPDLKERIIADAARIQAQRGEQFEFSSSRQTITLGE